MYRLMRLLSWLVRISIIGQERSDLMMMPADADDRRVGPAAISRCRSDT
jgi:hypothetical protein